ncbi:MAG: S-methyl-5'-thioinosine phosphorylase [Gammaproteobacteria bacterium]|nr:S-methyl-5'-thioinosine phosphorylase [Gammaproteobacteria bacterium]
MTLAAIIGGSGLTNLKDFEVTHREVKRSPYGEPSSPLVFGRLGGQEVVFLARHGQGHTIPPHEVNYRANIWAIKETGATRVIAVNAVGGIAASLKPGQLVFPDQIIDYTYSRNHTFFGNGQKPVTHIDFTYPYCEELRRVFIQAARAAGIEAAEHATYAATQGPRFESIAEIKRLERDGADIVGMTGMPETGLARELGLCYASIAVIANPAAGKAAGVISLKEIERTLESGMQTVRSLLERTIPLLLTV